MRCNRSRNKDFNRDSGRTTAAAPMGFDQIALSVPHGRRPRSAGAPRIAYVPGVLVTVSGVRPGYRTDNDGRWRALVRPTPARTALGQSPPVRDTSFAGGYTSSVGRKYKPRIWRNSYFRMYRHASPTSRVTFFVIMSKGEVYTDGSFYTQPVVCLKCLIAALMCSAGTRRQPRRPDNKLLGRPETVVDDGEVKVIVETDPPQTTSELAAGFGWSNPEELAKCCPKRVDSEKVLVNVWWTNAGVNHYSFLRSGRRLRQIYIVNNCNP
ncbi:hypothetical protein EVAR_6364_1 [Eumeta japonica]|uniref:Uncharacterized protein n=1 Tax=Eumeta variegata TaxID=151549 RepID=A0A4C1TCI3_EUMVA|nr:hypothetical protein EVAR_6364_1 [Eumeta japonica]